jgi:hypothetical protein
MCEPSVEKNHSVLFHVVSIDYFHIFLLESKKGQILVAFRRCVAYVTS